MRRITGWRPGFPPRSIRSATAPTAPAFILAPLANTASGGYIREFEVAAVAEEWAGGLQRFSQRNRFTVGDECSVLEPAARPFR